MRPFSSDFSSEANGHAGLNEIVEYWCKSAMHGMMSLNSGKPAGWTTLKTGQMYQEPTLVRDSTKKNALIAYIYPTNYNQLSKIYNKLPI